MQRRVRAAEGNKGAGSAPRALLNGDGSSIRAGLGPEQFAKRCQREDEIPGLCLNHQRSIFPSTEMIQWRVSHGLQWDVHAFSISFFFFLFFFLR